MKLVKFPNGSYGVRTSWFFGWKFLDLQQCQFEWRSGDKWFYTCMGSKDKAINAMPRKSGKYVIEKNNR